MYKTEFIQKLKQSNLSVDSEKTKERAESLWKSASNEVKHQIEEDSGSSRASIYRIYHTGAISAKMIIAFAQRLNCNPYFLTGETDENDGFSEEITENFLREKGYSRLLDSLASSEIKVRARRKKSAPATASEEIPVAAPVEENEVQIPEIIVENAETSDIIEPNPETDCPPDDITGEELNLLLSSLVIRARYSRDAKENLEKVKKLLY